MTNFQRVNCPACKTCTKNTRAAKRQMKQSEPKLEALQKSDHAH